MMSDWDLQYQRLVDFRNRFGHTNVHLYEGQEYKDLVDWLSRQRSLYREYKNGEEPSVPNGEISEAKVTLLEAIDTQLDINKQEQRHEEYSNQSHGSFESEAMLMPRIPRNDVELMDIADAYVIRAVLHAPERRRAHNELMHNSHKALFTENFNEKEYQRSTDIDENMIDLAAGDIVKSNPDDESMNRG